MSYIIVITTCGSEAEAQQLSSALIEMRLAACVQTHAIRSVYRWQGAIETANELRLMIKARSADYAEIERLIRSMHSYDNPQIVAVPVVAGAQPYLDWMDEETARS